MCRAVPTRIQPGEDEPPFQGPCTPDPPSNGRLAMFFQDGTRLGIAENRRPCGSLPGCFAAGRNADSLRLRTRLNRRAGPRAPAPGPPRGRLHSAHRGTRQRRRPEPPRARVPTPAPPSGVYRRGRAHRPPRALAGPLRCSSRSARPVRSSARFPTPSTPAVRQAGSCCRSSARSPIRAEPHRRTHEGRPAGRAEPRPPARQSRAPGRRTRSRAAPRRRPATCRGWRRFCRAWMPGCRSWAVSARIRPGKSFGGYQGGTAARPACLPAGPPGTGCPAARGGRAC